MPATLGAVADLAGRVGLPLWRTLPEPGLWTIRGPAHADGSAFPINPAWVPPGRD
ncbi:hypothetical protein [Nocardioides sp. HB32]